jgi:hypothetical protein
MTPPPSRWKLRGLLAASLLLVVVTGTFTYARFRNDAARRRVDAACGVIERGERARKAAMESGSKLAAANDDADKITAIEQATRASRVCEPLRQELSGYRWSFGRRWSPPAVNTKALPSREEIAAIGARARPRCIAQVGMAMELWKGGSDGLRVEKRQELLDQCDLEKQSEKAFSGEANGPPLRLLDEWPAALERMAAGVAPAPQPASSSLE